MIEQTPEQLAWHIADTVGETEKQPRWLIRRIVEVCGVEQSRAWLEKTLEIEATGGWMLPDGSRRHTPGGVFFRLVREQATSEQAEFFAQNRAEQRKRAGEHKRRMREKQQGDTLGTSPERPNPAAPRVIVVEVEALNAQLEDTGKATSMKITLIGRPGKLEMQPNLVITHMTHQAKTASFPKGVPPMPETPTEYTVYIAAKQWKKVEEAIANPEDALIIEGMVAFSPEINGMAVYAQNVVTKLLQKQSKGGDKSAPEASASATPVASSASPIEEKRLAPPSASADRAALTQALAEAEAKVAAINALPFSQRKGLVEAIRAVEDLKRQIAEAQRG